MYDVTTLAWAGVAQPVDETATRQTAFLGFEVTPVLQAGQTYAEAMAGLFFSYFCNGKWALAAPGASTAFTGTVNLQVVNGSARVLVGGSNLMLISAPTGQQYLVTILELPGEAYLPDDAAAASEGGGGGNPSGSVTTTEVGPWPLGYTPTSSGDGASIAGAKGCRVWFFVVGGDIANPVPAGASLLCYRQIAVAGVGGAWNRVPDLDIPLNANSAGLLGIGLADQTFAVGTAGERILWVPNAACGGSGVTGFAEVLEIQT